MKRKLVLLGIMGLVFGFVLADELAYTWKETTTTSATTVTRTNTAGRTAVWISAIYWKYDQSVTTTVTVDRVESSTVTNRLYTQTLSSATDNVWLPEGKMYLRGGEMLICGQGVTNVCYWQAELVR